MKVLPPRYAPPTTKVGVKRCAVRDKVKETSWTGSVDPVNILIVSAVVLTPVIGATPVLGGVLALLLALVVVFW